MLTKPDAVKRYRSALDRFLRPALSNFFAQAFPRLFGPVILEKIADELLQLIDRLCPLRDTLRPGQLLWNALDKNTRGDSPHRRYVPVVLSIITPEDIQKLSDGVHPSIIAQEAIARIIREAYDQGGILSTRDIALFSWRSTGSVSQIRLQYEHQHQCVLPHTGALHDMGSTVTHKEAIVSKVIIEKKDPAVVARETCHTQPAVDRYLKDYHRVKMLHLLHHDVPFIHHATGIACNVIKQYLEIISHENDGHFS